MTVIITSSPKFKLYQLGPLIYIIYVQLYKIENQCQLTYEIFLVISLRLGNCKNQLRAPDNVIVALISKERAKNKPQKFTAGTEAFTDDLLWMSVLFNS